MERVDTRIDSRVRRWLLAAAVFSLVFAIYGSLVPLDFKARSISEALAAIAQLPEFRLSETSRTDLAVNVLLFVPIGFFWSGAISSGGIVGRIAASLVILAASVALSVSVEFLQFFFPPRTPAVSDMLGESIGALIGVCCWWAFGERFANWLADWNKERSEIAAMERVLYVYLFIVFAYSLLPLDLTISPVEVFRKFRDGRVVVLPFGWQHSTRAELIYDIVSDVTIWAVAAFLRRSAGRGDVWRIVAWIIVVAMLLETMQLFVISRVTDVTDILLAAIGGLIGSGLGGYFRPDTGRSVHSNSFSSEGLLRPIGVWILALTVWLCVLAAVFWYPFNFRMDWEYVSRRAAAVPVVPLTAYYSGSEFRAITEVLHKVGFFAPLGVMLAIGTTWLVRRLRLNGVMLNVLASLVLLAISGAIEGAQLLLPGKSADPTDWFLESVGSLSGYWLSHWLSAVRHRRDDKNARIGRQRGTSAFRDGLVRVPMIAGSADRRADAVRMVILYVLIVAGLSTAIRLPGVPYNVRELFIGAGNPAAIAVFGIALVWIGAGSAWMAGIVCRSNNPILAVPVWGFLIALVSLLLLLCSVTEESLSDIVGSSNLWRSIRHDGALGEWAARAIGIVPSYLVAFIERAVRFAALYIPVTMLIAAFLVGFGSRGCPGSFRSARRRLAIGMLLTLLACKWIVFDVPSTDNITELIAVPGVFGVGGLPFLFALLVLFCACTAAIARPNCRQPPGVLAVLLLTLCCTVGGWVLLNLALESRIEKYGTVFSGVQFLLGPDRSHHLSSFALFGRWAILCTAALVAVSISARAGRHLPGAIGNPPH